ncbi:lytic transglycosylase [Rhodococcus triatomae]|uniref:Transglycosylase SLT domain-containing protein n=1 Tax=Rhodococcus triatomae TaxID=300028 RepID=A0A1G7ZR83_9NOCA|nr:bifunctional lytic transglycosylase/C40 family peptidase [Rhodococcus triatomae]QNG17974.1 lytic transglycosylase [Rhodococcus triatomae]QNG22358.1 lytic transglycosylase [Rhodococcus triatomae]SDH11087.1 Transglycosylase SLT domain-containing protein [Rhodococcus triatomae]
MSVDAAAIIVAITTAAGAIVQGADIPQELQEQAEQAIASIEEAAPEVRQQVGDALATLPDGTRQQAEELLSRTSDAVTEATDPFIPPEARADAEAADEEQAEPVPGQPPGPRLEGVPLQPDPRYGAPPATSGGGGAAAFGSPAVGPSVLSELAASAPSVLGGLGALIPSVPAAYAGSSVAPVGAVAVFAPWIRKAGSLCEEITPPTLAALYSVQSGFRWGANAPVSRLGARGPGQFLPGEWSRYGEDADGDGKVDILGVADSTMASGRMLCDLYQQVEQWKGDGVVSGDTLDLTLAAYTAGPDTVRVAGGIPPGMADLENETVSHVHRIRSLEESFARMLSPFFYGAAGLGESRVVDVAMRFIGLPYVWGGGNINGPTMGGFDCSGLTSFAVYAATGITLPRTSETQWHVGTEIPLTEAKPGDLLFGNWQAGGPGHVAIYVGNGQMLHAPTTGDIVRIGPVFDGMKARRIV